MLQPTDKAHLEKKMGFVFSQKRSLKEKNKLWSSTAQTADKGLSFSEPFVSGLRNFGEIPTSVMLEIISNTPSINYFAFSFCTFVKCAGAANFAPKAYFVRREGKFVARKSDLIILREFRRNSYINIS